MIQNEYKKKLVENIICINYKTIILLLGKWWYWTHLKAIEDINYFKSYHHNCSTCMWWCHEHMFILALSFKDLETMVYVAPNYILMRQIEICKIQLCNVMWTCAKGLCQKQNWKQIFNWSFQARALYNF